MRTISLLPMLATVALAGCSSSADESGTDEGATVIEPNGTDAPGKLVVTLPAGTAEATKFTWRTTAQPAGTPIASVPVGDQDFTLSSSGVNMPGRANIKAGQTTTVQAALVAPDAVSGPRTLGLAKDPTNWAIQVNVTESPVARGGVGSIPATSNGSIATALLAGAYEVNFGVGGMDGVPVKVAPGDSKKAVLTDPAQRRVLRIKAPATRDMAAADCGNNNQFANGTGYRFYANYNGAYFADADMPAGSAIEVGLAPSKPNGGYRLVNSTWATAVDLPMPTVPGTPATLAMGRVDIDDVLINNAQPRVPGTYMVYLADAAGNRGNQFLRCSPKTKTGVDLPPGNYRIEVTYSTVEAGNKVDVHQFSVH